MKKQGNTRAAIHLTGPLLLLGAAFLLGGVLGGELVRSLPPEETLSSLLQGVPSPGWSRTLWCVLRWPVGAVVLGWLPLAGLTLPLWFLLRGCVLAYNLAGMLSLGENGLLWCLVALGPTCLLTVPALFLLGTRALIKRSPAKGHPWPRIWTVAAITALLIALTTEQSMVPEVLYYIFCS